MSTINAALNWSGLGNIGFFNPTLYGTQNVTPGYVTGVLIDIQGGTNGVNYDSGYPPGYPGYSAGLSDDNCTGGGTIYGREFGIGVLLEQSGTSLGQITVATPKVTSTTMKATWTPSSGAKAYVAVLFLRYGSIPFNLVQAYLLPPDVSAITFKDLTPYTDYGFIVFGYNASGYDWNSPGLWFQTPKK